MIRRIGFVLAICLLGMLGTPAAWADGSSAVLGTEDFMAGALPPPGFHYVNYMWYYYANARMDNGGNEMDIPGFKAYSFANVFRPIYVAPVTILGANPAWHAVVPLAYRMIDSSTPFINEEKAQGIADIYLSPLILGWHFPDQKLHLIAGLDVIVPTGKYDEHAPMTTLGNNHWTFEPAVAATAFLPGGFSANLKLMYDFHTKNTDFIPPGETEKSDYQTGQQFHGDFCVDYGVIEKLRVGVAGFFLKSITDDKLDGDNLDDSKEQLVGLGPAVCYSPLPNLSIMAKFLWETAAKNHTQGGNAWLKAVYSF